MHPTRASLLCIIHEAIKWYTLFSECLAQENHLNFLMSQGHRPRPHVILILSMEFLNGVFCILLSRPFDKLDMTQGRGTVPRGHQSNWAKSMCRSFLEECIKPYHIHIDIPLSYFFLNCTSNSLKDALGWFPFISKGMNWLTLHFIVIWNK